MPDSFAHGQFQIVDPLRLFRRGGDVDSLLLQSRLQLGDIHLSDADLMLRGNCRLPEQFQGFAARHANFDSECLCLGGHCGHFSV